MRLSILFLFLFSVVSFTVAQPKYEVRAAWVTSAYGLDWPKTKATSAQNINRQKAELINILDKLKEANFNTVLFQVRTTGEVYYPSKIEPYNALLTGRPNGNPGYDPLAFAIEECHKRGMECHAWMVTIPLGNRKHIQSLGNNTVVKKQSSICLQYKNSWYLNPGHPDTKRYLMSLVQEVVDNYDIDGIHFDYLRYPEKITNFPDTKEYKNYGKRKDINQWRRDNITEIVRYLYKGVKASKRWVKVSSSPVGKYKDTSRFTSRSWNAYHSVYQDVQAWLAEGIQDQLYPMMYFRGNNFYPFALDWNEQGNNRHIVPGLGIYFLDPKEGNWSSDEIERQINFTRKNKLAGQAYYRVQYLMENTQGIYNELLTNYYTTPALQPAMSWLDNIAPSAPSYIHVNQNNGYIHINWGASTDSDKRNQPYYILYGSDTYPVDTSNPQNIIAQRIRKTNYLYAPVFPWEEYEYYAITAMDRYGNESEAIQMKR
ncbi:glycoside hydrolase family 10 protein [Bacteroides sp. 519]|uniref:glycoside hydrolase family 10 protein n=1 Tax=Bacteroides sp. 519 TaxID=2302937 RepID=UPI0013D3E641|nr:family 10 glycosylhydrolase [Bacteroides sp. 519]NDV58118.1 S-layer protein [Bacteroides sp. 519]